MNIKIWSLIKRMQKYPQNHFNKSKNISYLLTNLKSICFIYGWGSWSIIIYIYVTLTIYNKVITIYYNWSLQNINVWQWKSPNKVTAVSQAVHIWHFMRNMWLYRGEIGQGSWRCCQKWSLEVLKRPGQGLKGSLASGDSSRLRLKCQGEGSQIGACFSLEGFKFSWFCCVLKGVKRKRSKSPRKVPCN